MTSISIPSVTKLNQPSDATPTSNTIFATMEAPSSPLKKGVEEDKAEISQPSPSRMVVEDLAQSLPSLIRPSHHDQHHFHHRHHKCHIWREQCGEREGLSEKTSSDSSLATSLLEVAAASTFSQLLTESTTETTTHTLTVEEDFEPAHACFSSVS